MKDLTKIEGCQAVGPQLLPIIQNIVKYNLQELKFQLTQILANPNTSVSPEKASKYMKSMSNIYSLHKMQMFLTDIYLASANLNVTPKRK